VAVSAISLLCPFIDILHILYKILRGFPMSPCTNLYFLSTLACQLAQCLDEAELEILSADLTTLADMLASILVRGGLEPENIEADSD
jgi:hypothetical protein